MSAKVTCSNCKEEVPADQAIIRRAQMYGSEAVYEEKILCFPCKKRITKASWVLVVLILLFVPFVMFYLPNSYDLSAGAITGITVGGVLLLIVVFKMMCRPSK